MPEYALIPKLDSQQLQYTAGAVLLLAVAGVVARLLFPPQPGVRREKARKGMMEVTVKWGKEKIRVPLPPLETPVSEFRKVLSDATGLPPDGFKIIYSGAVLKDNTAPLSAFGIKPGRSLAIIGLNEPLPTPAATAAAPAKEKPTEQTTIEKIRTEMSSLTSTLSPELESFLETGETEDKETRVATHTRLGELILQVLLRLDALSVEGWEEARKERRAAVKHAQDMLNRLDDGWKKMRGGA
ncbi:hypothetical protein CALVIDRAFT_525911 [Calocera viscosa TUFC12733]|uniref:BAG domain-containing protein n=1 Tax=Calocera viscosa (strain TUFC12733) TaxID=1330018 RepID=A0A167PN85_CALVF|nr:hypothetical protein CALVIDRAFT_525911 [Calocera viscosa TUFC12733]